MPHAPRDHLSELVAGARGRVDRARAITPTAQLREHAGDLGPVPGFAAALSGPGVAIIAEIKRASPSKGPLAPDLDAAVQARRYRDGGASAVSVLTEPERFLGSLDDLAAAAGTGLPMLRKDFIVDPHQVWEARVAGASAVLLIVAALDRGPLDELLLTCSDAGLDALVEVHDEDEARTAVDAGATVIGVNARDLRTFDVDRGAFHRVRPSLPPGVVAVDESGISTPDDVHAAGAAGADAVLVGEALVTAADPRGLLAAMVAAGARSLAGR